MSSHQLVCKRSKLALILVLIGFLAVSARLFYWQVIRASSSQAIIERQTSNSIRLYGSRGRIFTAEGALLVGNKQAWDVYLNRRELVLSEDELLIQLKQSLKENNYSSAETVIELIEKALKREANWLKILEQIPPDLQGIIQQKKISGIHLIETETRSYPEGSMAAHITGFVGRDADSEPIGYFGVEGALNRELSGDSISIVYKHDGQGRLLADQTQKSVILDGRDVKLTIRRDIQFIVEKVLEEGIQRFKSQSGEIVVLDPKTGAILALATWPHYDPASYRQYSTHDFKNPTLANLYEPGSTFKVLTVATGIDLGLISPETECTKCSGPRVISGHTINTWNKVFQPNITMTEALRKSDNTAMVFIAEKIGSTQLASYIKNFGISQALNLDLQEDSNTPFPGKIGPVELATISFGQGISTNTLQMTRAISAIANKGVIMKPYLIESVSDPKTQEVITHEPEILRRVVKAETAETVTKMMIESAPERRNWINQNYLIAGKSGTSQIPSETGGYRETGTIASYVGFAPADDPKFVMMVKLTEPQVTQWGATTAVPIWYELADKIILLL